MDPSAPQTPCFSRRSAVCMVGGLVLAVAACSKAPAPAAQAPLPVRAQIASLSSYAAPVALTGEIKARIQSDLAFRFAGRIAKRLVDVGDRVEPGQVLATLESKEQTADVNSATAAVQSAEASLRKVAATFERQKALLATGYTTQTAYDNALQALRAAEAMLDSARSNLATAQDQLTYTALRADAPGIVTARNAEAGQVVEAAQAVFTVARDGGRDAVFDVYEALLAHRLPDNTIQLALPSNPAVKATGRIREVAPAIDPSSGTVRVKIAVDAPPPEMSLGAAVVGVGRSQPRTVFRLPWTAFFTQDGKPTVWVVDPQSKVVSSKSIVIDSYRSGELLVSAGLEPGEIVVTAGVQLLRPGQLVAPQISNGSANKEAAK